MTNLIDEAESFIEGFKGVENSYFGNSTTTNLIRALVERLRNAEGVVEAAEKLITPTGYDITIDNMQPLFKALAKYKGDSDEL